MYTILHARDISVSLEIIEVLEYVHVLVDVERIGLLRKIVRAHSTTHLCRFVLWLTGKMLSFKQHKWTMRQKWKERKNPVLRIRLVGYLRARS